MKNFPSDAELLNQVKEQRSLPKYYKILAEMAHDIIFVIDNHGTVKYINSYGAKIFKVPPKKLLNKNINVLFSADIANRMLANINKAISTGKPLTYEGPIQYPQYTLWLDTQLIPIRDSNNRLNSVIGISRDITEKKLSESINVKYTSSLCNLIEILGQLSLENSLKNICQNAVLFAKKRLGFDRMEIFIAKDAEKDVVSFYCDANSCKENFTVLNKPYEDIHRLLHGKVPVVTRKLTENNWSISIPIRSKIGHNIGVLRITSGSNPDNYTTSLLRLFSLGLSYIIQNLKTNNAVKHSDDLLKKIMDAVDESILVLSPDIRIVYANTYFFNSMKQLGLPPLKIGDFFLKGNPEYQKAFKNVEGYYRKIVKTKKPHDTLDTTVQGSAKTGYYSAKRIPLLDENNKLELILNVSRNVTEEKTTLNNLKESEAFLNNVLDSIQDGISVLDKDLKILRVNKVMENWYKDSMPLVGKKCYQAYYGKNTSCAVCPTQKTLKTGVTCNETVPRMDKNKKIIGWQDLYAYPLKNAKTGKTDGVIEYVKDITKDKASEKNLLDSEVKYRELWDNAPVAYHTLNPDGVVTSVNETELKMLGYDKDEMVGKPIFDFIEPAQREEAQLRFLRKIAGKETIRSGNRVYLRSDGSKIVVSLDDVLEYNEKHEVISVRTTMVDVTRQRQIEDQLKNSFSKLKKTMDDAMRVITRLVEMRDPYTAGHQVRVAQLACAIAKELGLSEDSIERIRIAGLLHDLGKINVPIEILSKPGKISESEFNIIKVHPSIGYEILKEMDFPYPVAETVLQHHERIDGKGYPYGLTGKDIILEAKIVMVSDVVEAMSSHRPYRASKGTKEALKEISKNKGKLYDLKVAKACLNVFKLKKFHFTDR
ncbi:MAG: hypothetical protein A2231_01695 [Candidatus Firestonebacteria bacterium RIFOXYA2_FULL_40_8]|nr:MAG: hypothetical protein A2231_01695 [Candidatus Firestonebacteria bacterium RIFOXYA2_FULL_40_8]